MINQTIFYSRDRRIQYQVTRQISAYTITRWAEGEDEIEYLATIECTGDAETERNTRTEVMDYAKRLLAQEENTARAAYISQADIQRQLVEMNAAIDQAERNNPAGFYTGK